MVLYTPEGRCKSHILNSRLTVLVPQVAATAAANVGWLEEAAGLIRQSLALNERYPRSLLVLGHIEIMRGLPKEALAPLQLALAIDSNYARAHYELAMALNHLGNRTGARTHMDVAAELQPNEYSQAAADLGIKFWQQKSQNSPSSSNSPLPTSRIGASGNHGGSASAEKESRGKAPTGRRRRRRTRAAQ